MKNLQCVLLIDEDNNIGQAEETVLRGFPYIKTFKVIHDTEEALLFLNKECSKVENDECICPEYVILDVGIASLDTPEFGDTLKRINQARQRKIQVIILLDKNNNHDLSRITDLGIDYIRKPLTKEPLRAIFERNDRFSNLEEYL